MSEELLQCAVDTWGVEAQVVMGIEEMGELIVQLSHAWRGRALKENLIEEIADVQIMIWQLKLIFGTEEVNAAIDQKLARLKMRLERGEMAVTRPNK